MKKATLWCQANQVILVPKTMDSYKQEIINQISPFHLFAARYISFERETKVGQGHKSMGEFNTIVYEFFKLAMEREGIAMSSEDIASASVFRKKLELIYKESRMKLPIEYKESNVYSHALMEEFKVPIKTSGHLGLRLRIELIRDDVDAWTRFKAKLDQEKDRRRNQL